jgi:hypothetical protein
MGKTSASIRRSHPSLRCILSLTPTQFGSTGDCLAASTSQASIILNPIALMVISAGGSFNRLDKPRHSCYAVQRAGNPRNICRLSAHKKHLSPCQCCLHSPSLPINR